MIKSVLAFVMCLKLIRCALEPLVYNGEDSDIKEFQHSACLNAHSCVHSSGATSSWICGSSVLNQRILLTAAHCVFSCTANSIMIVQFGNEDRTNSSFVFVTKFEAHDNFNEHASDSDVALVKVGTPLPLNDNVGRIAIYPSKFNPYHEEGKIAGWGFIDEIQQILSTKLHHISQKIVKREDCEKLIGENLPVGIFCWGDVAAKSYVSMGDSGSALVVRNYIQVGLVSYKKTSVRSIGMYTDVGYYYDWIIAFDLRLYCS